MSHPHPVTLALFDLDHTLLDGDGDDLWCRFAVHHKLVDPAVAPENDRLGQDYRKGLVSVQTFSAFYASLLAGRTPAEWAPWQDRFLAEVIRHRLPPAARARVEHHRAQGHTLVLTTASNRVIAERSATELGFEHLLATELELEGGRFTGRLQGIPNMREGKLVRLRAWLASRGWPDSLLDTAWFYSDSINDLPLLQAVGLPVATNPDAKLLHHAQRHDWGVVQLL